MSEFAALPAGWVVWSDEDDGRAVLAFRPDVFDADAFPAPCLPTIYLTSGRRGRRPGTDPTDRVGGDDWHVTFYLEPDVRLCESAGHETRATAVERALELAREFAAGAVEYRDCYQVPREAYLERLDELTGGSTS